MRSSESPHRSDGASTAFARLPCPQAPLQSITAAASLTTPSSVPRCGQPLRIHPSPSSGPPSTPRPSSSASEGRRSDRKGRVAGAAHRLLDPAVSEEIVRACRAMTEITFGPRGPDPDRLSGCRRPKPEQPHPSSPARQWQAIAKGGRSTRWRAHRRSHVGVAIVSRSARSAHRPTVRKRRFVAAGSRRTSSPRAKATLALRLPPPNDRRRSSVHGKP